MRRSSMNDSTKEKGKAEGCANTPRLCITSLHSINHPTGVASVESAEAGTSVCAYCMILAVGFIEGNIDMNRKSVFRSPHPDSLKPLGAVHKTHLAKSQGE